MYKRHLESLWQSALDRHVDHQQAEAEALYRQILDQHPGHAGALGMLAVILADGTNEVEAEAVILRHLKPVLKVMGRAVAYGLGGRRGGA
jgi:hypothetical protein